MAHTHMLPWLADTAETVAVMAPSAAVPTTAGRAAAFCAASSNALVMMHHAAHERRMCFLQHCVLASGRVMVPR